jgi:hypothetical protein
MTFCNAECDNKDCHRMLTDEVWAKAAKWWGSDDAPVAVADFSKNCTVFIIKKDKTDA